MGSVHYGDCFQSMMMALAQARSMAAMDPFAGTAPVAWGAAGYGNSGILDASDAYSGNEGGETQCGDASQNPQKHKKKKSNVFTHTSASKLRHDAEQLHFLGELFDGPMVLAPQVPSAQCGC